jgi:hypothetical protein
MRPNPTLSLRVPPFTTKELKAVVEALKYDGVDLRHGDLVGALIARAARSVRDANALEQLGADVREYKKKARKLGF